MFGVRLRHECGLYTSLYGIFLLDMSEAFVFRNSLFALTLLALFGKVEITGIIYQGNFTRQEDPWQKNPLVLGNFYSFSTSG